MMNVIWSVWLFGLIPLSFAAFEGYALLYGKTTLSRYVWNLSKAWPPFPLVAGALIGFLAAHFWWTCMGCPVTIGGG
jgi:hypothetical protein